MKRVLCIGLLLTVLFTGCERTPLRRSAQTPELGITLEMPAASTVKAMTPASDEENAIHDLTIWVFHSTTHDLVAKLELDATADTDDFPQPGGVKRYSLPVSWDFALERPRPQVDVFVLANSATLQDDPDNPDDLGISLTVDSPYDEVYGAFFGDDFFSPSAKITQIPATGLPMSGVSKNMSISGEEPSLSVATVSLERCVSKIRFLFCQMYTETDDPAEVESFSVDKIVLNGDMIPTQEYVFAPSAPRVGSTCVAAPVEYVGAATVAASATPELYAYRGQDGPSYEAVINEAKADNKLTDCGAYYMRESDRQLSGVIHYTVVKGAGTSSETSRSETAPFTLAAAGDFARNHVWTVYGYYVSKRSLQLSVSVMPWDKSDYKIDYSMSSLMVTWKLSVLDGSYASKEEVRNDQGKVLYYNVTLKNNRPCSAYLYVATPEGGKLQVIPVGVDGSEDAFAVSFGDNAQEEIAYTDIKPSVNNGRIDISIDRKEGYAGTYTGKSISLSFKAFTADGESEIDGASECIDQVYYFILP